MVVGRGKMDEQCGRVLAPRPANEFNLILELERRTARPWFSLEEHERGGKIFIRSTHNRQLRHDDKVSCHDRRLDGCREIHQAGWGEGQYELTHLYRVGWTIFHSVALGMNWVGVASYHVQTEWHTSYPVASAS